MYVLNCSWIRGNERGLVKGLVVWPDEMVVSHLQFVDDDVLLYAWI